MDIVEGIYFMGFGFLESLDSLFEGMVELIRFFWEIIGWFLVKEVVIFFLYIVVVLLFMGGVGIGGIGMGGSVIVRGVIIRGGWRLVLIFCI